MTRQGAAKKTKSESAASAKRTQARRSTKAVAPKAKAAAKKKAVPKKATRQVKADTKKDAKVKAVTAKKKPSKSKPSKATAVKASGSTGPAAPATLLWTGCRADAARTVVAFAHGAGAPMDHDWMNDTAAAIADKGNMGDGVAVARFEFPYMAKRRGSNPKRGPPDQAPVLLSTFENAIKSATGQCPKAKHVILAGKSMGGRMATMLASDAALARSLGVTGVVVFGYPFVPMGKTTVAPERTAHLSMIEVPCVLLQGERDTMGSRPMLGPKPWAAIAKGSKSLRLCWMNDGDHSLAPRKSSGTTLAENIAAGLAEAKKALRL